MSPLSIFSEAPVWVWPLLGLLILVGLRASRTRNTRIEMYWLIPFLGLIPLSGVWESPSPFLALAGFLTTALLGIFWGSRYQKRITLARNGPNLTLRGEWVTLAAMMALFWMNFADGFLRAVAPHLLENPLISIAFSGFGGLFSGQFMGRAISILRMPSSIGQKGARGAP